MRRSRSAENVAFLTVFSLLNFLFDFSEYCVYDELMKTTQAIKLSDIVSVDTFLLDLKQDRIQDRAHPADPELRIFSYTKKTQFGGLWSSASKLARGLILHVPEGDFTRATVRGRGLPKFFTVAQTESDWGRAKLIDDDENVIVSENPVIPWNMKAVVSQKVNGALGLGYIDPFGKFRISTKGSFDSLESRVANRVLDTEYAHVDNVLSTSGFMDEFTPLFEIITPERPHPVDYGNFEGLIYLGYINNGTGKWHPATGKWLFNGGHFFESPLMGFDGAKQREFSNLLEAVEAPYELNTEGFVVTVVDGGPDDIYKVKPTEYLELRRLFYALQDTELKDYLLESKYWQKVPEIDDPSQIDLSALVGDMELSPQLQTMLEGRREAIFQNVILPTRNMVKAVMVKATKWVMFDGVPRSKGDMARHILATIPKEDQGLYFPVFGILNGEDPERLYQIAFKKVLAGDTVDY